MHIEVSPYIDRPHITAGLIPSGVIRHAVSPEISFCFESRRLVSVHSTAGSCTTTAVHPPSKVKDIFPEVSIPMTRDVKIENFSLVDP